MSSRALRKLQREPASVPAPREPRDSDDDEEEASLAPRAAPKNAFRGLLEVDDSSSEEEQTAPQPIQDNSDDEDVLSEMPLKQKKSKAKKKKAKRAQAQHDPQKATKNGKDADEEAWAMLNAVSLSPATDSTSHASRDFLAVEYRFLSADAEMKRIFGSQGERESGRVTKRPMRQTWFGSPRSTWPRMTERPGLTMVIDEAPQAPVNATVGVRFFKLQHSAAYQSVQLKFLRCVSSFDHNSIAALLNAHPYHVDSLLQMSDVCKMGADAAMAAELTARALFCFECAFHTMFNPAAGNCRLSYNHFENRAFFLALFRHVGFVASRGCWRTAFEVTKFLLSIDPTDDPLGAMLMIDYYAIRSNQYDYLTDMFEAWSPKRLLDWLPNFAFSYALALFLVAKSEDQTAKATEALTKAIKRFPSCVQPLADKCSFHLLPHIAGHAFFNSSPVTSSEQSLEALVQLYVHRSYSVWKPPEVLEWLQGACVRVISCVDAGNDRYITTSAERCIFTSFSRRLIPDSRKTHFAGMPRNICRHIVVSECEAALKFLPPAAAQETSHSYDPLPPPNSSLAKSIYDERLRETQGPPASAVEMFFRSLLPSFNVAEQGANPGAPAFALNTLRGPVLNSLLQLAQSARGLFEARPAQDGAPVQHEFDEDDEYLQDILAQFPDADPAPEA